MTNETGVLIRALEALEFCVLVAEGDLHGNWDDVMAHRKTLDDFKAFIDGVPDMERSFKFYSVATEDSNVWPILQASKHLANGVKK